LIYYFFRGLGRPDRRRLHAQRRRRAQEERQVQQPDEGDAEGGARGICRVGTVASAQFIQQQHGVKRHQFERSE